MKKIIIATIGILILVSEIFFFTNNKQPEQTQEQEVLSSTLKISKEYATLRYQTDNVLINAKNYADYDAWNKEMSDTIEKWKTLENSAQILENLAKELTEEKLSFKFLETAQAYTKEEVTSIIDKAPMGKKISTLAKHLGVDAKMAQLILNETQNMISREAYGEEGDVFQTCENQAIVVKNASKVTLFVGTIALTGGTAAIATGSTLSQAAVIVSGADLTLEITDDTAKMALGDKNKISSIVGDARKITEPASAILMISTLPNNLVKGIDKLNAVVFGADQLNSTIQYGSIVGIKLPTYKGNQSAQTMEVSVLEKEELEKWIIEKGGSTVTTKEDMERLLVEFGFVQVAEQNTKPKITIDGQWAGTLTYAKFSPSPESAGNDMICQSTAGLPITAPITIKVTSYSDGTIFNAEVNIAGGAYCQIYPDGWDKFSSVWKKNEDESFTMLGGGPITLKNQAVSISLPSGFSFIGHISDDGTTISGSAEQDRSGSGLGGGQLSFQWVVSRN